MKKLLLLSAMAVLLSTSSSFAYMPLDSRIDTAAEEEMFAEFLAARAARLAAATPSTASSVEPVVSYSTEAVSDGGTVGSYETTATVYDTGTAGDGTLKVNTTQTTGASIRPPSALRIVKTAAKLTYN